MNPFDLLVQVGYKHRLAIIVDDTNKLEGEPAPEVSPLLAAPDFELTT